MRSTTRLELTEAQRRELEKGYCLGEKHCFRMRCLAVLLKADGISASKVGERVDLEQHTVNKWLNRYKTEGIKGLETRPGRGRKPIDNGLFGRGGRPSCDRAGSPKREQGTGGVATSHWQGGQRIDVQTFFSCTGARYKRIRKRPRGKPSLQLYEYKVEKLQELEQKAEEVGIDLFYADESHICTEGHVPYGWQFRGEDVFIPSQKIAKLNIFGMTTRDNRYEGFTSRGSITSDMVADFLDMLSFRPRTRNLVVVLDNASIHRSRIIKEMRSVWESLGLFLFYLPPYSPHLNIAETLWRMLKGKWIRPQNYTSTDTLFYAANRALASVGTSLFINHSHYAA